MSVVWMEGIGGGVFKWGYEHREWEIRDLPRRQGQGLFLLPLI